MENIKYIIREVEPEATDFSSYFEDDFLKGESGNNDFCENLFVVDYDYYGRISGFNIEKYKNVVSQAENIIDCFDDVESKYNTYNSYKQVIEDYLNCKYSPKLCHNLKVWANGNSATKPEGIADFLTITTGKKWNIKEVRGYFQGDFVQVVYCTDVYSDFDSKKYGEIYLGCGKEFAVIELDENGKEDFATYGYIIADCEAWTDSDYKKIVCNWAQINEAETELQIIDDCQTYSHYTYRTA